MVPGENLVPPEDRILVLDFGSQYTQLIARRVREFGVYSAIYPYDISVDVIEAFAPAGVILSGGPSTVTSEFAASAPVQLFEMKTPILGICYGMQTMVAQLGGVVENASTHEYGYTQVEILENSRLLDGVASRNGRGKNVLGVWMSHGDRVIEVPENFKSIAASDNSPIAAIGDLERSYFGIQFHPEVTHTEHGSKIIENFLHKICGCKSSWKPDNLIASQIDLIRENCSRRAGCSGAVGRG